MNEMKENRKLSDLKDPKKEDIPNIHLFSCLLFFEEKIYWQPTFEADFKTEDYKFHFYRKI